MGKPFANPSCPEHEEIGSATLAAPTPVPTPADCAEPCDVTTEGGGECRIRTGNVIVCLSSQDGACADGQTVCPSVTTPDSTISRKGSRKQLVLPTYCQTHTQHPV